MPTKSRNKYNRGCRLSSNHRRGRRLAATLNNQGVEALEKDLDREAKMYLRNALSVLIQGGNFHEVGALAADPRDVLLSARIADVVTLDFDIPVSTESYVYQRDMFDDGMATFDHPLLIDTRRSTDARHCKAVMFYNLGLALPHEKKYRESMHAFVSALTEEERSRSYYRNESIAVEALHNTGRALYFLGKNKKARNVFEEALEFEDILAEKAHVDKNKLALKVASTKACLTCIKMVDFGKDFSKTPEPKQRQMIAEIVASLSESLSVKESLLGKDHMEVATVLNMIGDACDAMDDNKEEALSVLRRCLDIREKNLDYDHPDVLAVLKITGNIYYNHEDNEEAAALYRQFLDAAPSTLGELHRDVLEVRAKLAIISDDDVDQKMNIFEKLIEDGCNELGKDHTLVGMFWYNIGYLHWRKDDLDASVEAMNECLRIYQAKCGSDDIRTADVLISIGRIEGHRGEQDAQLKAFEAALMILQDNNLGSPRKVVDLLNDCGSVHEAKGDSAKAIEVYTAALSMSDTGGGEGEAYQENADSLHSLGWLTAKGGNISAGLKFLEDALKIKNSIHKEPHKSTAETLWAIAIWQEDLGNVDGAAISFQRTLEVELSLYGRDHTHVAQTLLRLANISEGRGQNEEALGYFQEALGIKRLLNSDRSEIADMLTQIGCIRMHRREMDLALAAFSEAADIAPKDRADVAFTADANNLRWYDIKSVCPDAASAA